MNSGNKAIVVTADDFGQSSENNKGVLAAHQAGILTATSIMVGGVAFNEAIAISQRNPDLHVGLHVCLSDGIPVCPADQIPLLVQRDGRFANDESLLHRAALSKAGREQIRAEVAAQFHLFFAALPTCSHVDVHRHSHRHPVVANAVFRTAALWQIRNVRIPYDPCIGRRWRSGDGLRYARITMLRAMARFYDLSWNQRVMGRDWTDPDELVKLINILPRGITELYFHPVICDDNHRFKADLAVFVDDRVRNVLAGIRCDEYKCAG